MRTYMGIDPGGVTGAFSFMNEDMSELKIYKFPSGDIHKFSKLLRLIPKQYPCIQACIEKVHANPKMGSKSAFSFGGNYHSWLLGLTLMEIPFEVVTPQKWQKEMLGPPEGRTTKERSIVAAHRLQPDFLFRKSTRCRTDDDNMTDAFHLARMARRLFAGI